MLKGFRDFIAQGNVIDLAVAVIIGGAFAPIVEALTKVLLNIIGALVGSPNFNSVGQFSINGSDPIQPGTIITAGLNFLLVAAAIYFCVVLPMNKLKERTRKAQEIEAADEVPAPSETELLVQIRDLLADKK